MIIRNISRIALPAFAAAMLLYSCDTKEDGPSGPSGGGEESVPVSFTLSSTVQSRTVLGDLVDGAYRVFWCNGDRVCVNGVKSDALHGIADSTVSTVFTVSGVSAPYSVVYPSIDCDGISADGVASISIPVAQKYVPGSFANGSAILYGRSEGSEIVLENLCGVVKVPVTAVRNSTLKSVEILSKSENDPVAGKFSLNTATGELVPVSGTVTQLLSLPAEGVQIAPSDTVNFFIALRKGDYPNGFNIRITDTQDRSMIAEWSENTQVPAGVILGLKAIDFESSTALEIVDIETWTLFAAAANAGDYSEWANSRGEVNLMGNISVAGDVPHIENWDGVFKGNGFTISRGNACSPIFETIAEGAEVRDLVVSGTADQFPERTEVVYDITTPVFVAPLARLNYGTVANCVSRVDFTYNNLNSIIYLGGLVFYNAGVLQDCRNEGSITMNYVVDNRRWGSVGGLACFASDGVASHSSSPGNYRNVESAGTFIRCTNAAPITVTKKSTSTTGGTHYLAGFDLGGIVASVNAGTAEHPAVFENCSNTADITFLEYEIQSTTTYNYACGFGGIAGCVANHTPLWKYGGSDMTTSWYEISSDYSSKYNDDTPDGYVAHFSNCSNTGQIECAARAGLATGFTATDMNNQRRQGYIGGIAGYVYGLSSAPVTFEGCSYTGGIRYSERYCALVAGGISGAASYASFKDCTVNIGSDAKVAPSVQPEWYVPKQAGANYRAACIFGGIAGISYKPVGIESCKSFVYADFPQTPAGNGQTASYIRFPAFFVGAAVPGADLTITGSCGLGGHLATWIYNPGTTNLDKKFYDSEITAVNYASFITYRDVYDNIFKDLWAAAGATSSIYVAITDDNFAAVSGKENVSYWDGK